MMDAAMSSHSRNSIALLVVILGLGKIVFFRRESVSCSTFQRFCLGCGSRGTWKTLSGVHGGPGGRSFRFLSFLLLTTVVLPQDGCQNHDQRNQADEVDPGSTL